GEQQGLLREIADEPRTFIGREPRGVAAVDEHSSRLDGVQPEDRPGQCALAGAHGSGDRDESAGWDLEIEIAQGGPLAAGVAKGETAERDRDRAPSSRRAAGGPSLDSRNVARAKRRASWLARDAERRGEQRSQARIRRGSALDRVHELRDAM